MRRYLLPLIAAGLLQVVLAPPEQAPAPPPEEPPPVVVAPPGSVVVPPPAREQIPTFVPEAGPEERSLQNDVHLRTGQEFNGPPTFSGVEEGSPNP